MLVLLIIFPIYAFCSKKDSDILYMSDLAHDYDVRTSLDLEPSPSMIESFGSVDRAVTVSVWVINFENKLFQDLIVRFLDSS